MSEPTAHENAPGFRPFLSPEISAGNDLRSASGEELIPKEIKQYDLRGYIQHQGGGGYEPDRLRVRA
jgi:hypothetical protein